MGGIDIGASLSVAYIGAEDSRKLPCSPCTLREENAGLSHSSIQVDRPSAFDVGAVWGEVIGVGLEMYSEICSDKVNNEAGSLPA